MSGKIVGSMEKKMENSGGLGDASYLRRRASGGWGAAARGEQASGAVRVQMGEETI